MFILWRHTFFVLAAALVAMSPGSSARDTTSISGAIEIVKPEAGYVIRPRNPANYHRGDTNEMQFVLRGGPEVNGKVNVTLARGKKRGIRIAKEISIINGEADATITIPLWKFRPALKAVLYNEAGKFDEISRKVTVKLPKKQAEQTEDSSDPTIEEPSEIGEKALEVNGGEDAPEETETDDVPPKRMVKL